LKEVAKKTRKFVSLNGNLDLFYSVDQLLSVNVSKTLLTSSENQSYNNLVREMFEFKKDGEYFSSILSNYPDPNAKYLKKFVISPVEIVSEPDPRVVREDQEKGK